jgi:diguanylate cyclase (GGDEF)-like protein
VRGADIACRVGGEEFAIIAPRATEEIAEVLAQRIRGALSQDYRAADPRFKMDDLTVTVGLAAMNGLETEPAKSLPEKIFKMADRRLYLGKQTGRNRVVGWTAEAEPPGLPLRGS